MEGSFVAGWEKLPWEIRLHVGKYVRSPTNIKRALAGPYGTLVTDTIEEIAGEAEVIPLSLLLALPRIRALTGVLIAVEEKALNDLPNEVPRTLHREFAREHDISPHSALPALSYGLGRMFAEKYASLTSVVFAVDRHCPIFVSMWMLGRISFDLRAKGDYRFLVGEGDTSAVYIWKNGRSLRSEPRAIADKGLKSARFLSFSHGDSLWLLGDNVRMVGRLISPQCAEVLRMLGFHAGQTRVGPANLALLLEALRANDKEAEALQAKGFDIRRIPTFDKRPSTYRQILAFVMPGDGLTIGTLMNALVADEEKARSLLA